MGNSAIRSHRNLDVWQRAVDLAVRCYEVTRAFPGYERYGLSSQMQRAATSVPSNVAEGRGRGSTKMFTQFLWIANGSLGELDTQIEIANRLNYVDAATINKLTAGLEVIGRMLTNLRRSLNKS